MLRLLRSEKERGSSKYFKNLLDKLNREIMKENVLVMCLVLLLAINVSVAFAQMHGATVNATMEMEILGEETNVTVPGVPREETRRGAEMEVEITPRVQIYISTCEAALQERNVPTDVAEKACKFAVGVQKQVQTLGERLAKCIAETYLANPNATYGELKQQCIQKIIEVLPVPKCPIVPLPHCLEGYPRPLMDDKGCVVSYICERIPALDLRMCVEKEIAAGTEIAEAMKRCAEEIRRMVRERVRETAAPLPPADMLEVYLRCIDLPEDAREEALELADEISRLTVEHREAVSSIASTCATQLRNLTSEDELARIGEECSQRIREVNREFKEKMKELEERIVEIYETYKSMLNVTCVNEILSARNVTIEMKEKVEEVLSNQSLEIEEKQMLIRAKLSEVLENLRERARKLPDFGNLTLREGIRELMTERRELKNEILGILKSDKPMLREVMKDSVVKGEIVNTLVENPEDRELLVEAIRDREAKIELIKHARTRLELKRQLLAQETVREILPTVLRQKLEKINVTDLDVEEIGNRTVVRAEVIETGRLFFIIPVKVPKVVKFIEEEIIAEQRPWWAFLVVS